MALIDILYSCPECAAQMARTKRSYRSTLSRAGFSSKL